MEPVFHRLLNLFTLLKVYFLHKGKYNTKKYKGLYFFTCQRSVVGVFNSNKIMKYFQGLHKTGLLAEKSK